MSAPRNRLAGNIALALTKRLVIDMPTARAAVDEAFRALDERQQYANLVMSAFDQFESEDKADERRELVDRKTDLHFKAKQTF